jgi:hypothetical protein
MRELASICALLAGVILLGASIFDLGYKRGFRRGFREGQEWLDLNKQHDWTAMETQVQREREKIWREET